ncbi:MAG: hypothetical protein Q4D98_13340 [Planctomycetia bacterium]|nr:hypothetical protein [Planctomycetia bacterium]
MEHENRPMDPRQLEFPTPVRSPRSYLLLAFQMVRSWLIYFAASFVAGLSMGRCFKKMSHGEPFPITDIWGGVFMISTLVALVFGIFSLVFQMKLLYRCWLLIQDGYARTTPGKAIGFLFLPIFNFYWIFVAYYGLVEDMNAYVRRHGLNVPQVKGMLPLVACILLLIPYVNSLGAVLFLPVMMTFAQTAALLQAEKNR